MLFWLGLMLIAGLLMGDSGMETEDKKLQFICGLVIAFLVLFYQFSLYVNTW